MNIVSAALLFMEYFHAKFQSARGIIVNTLRVKLWNATRVR